MAQRLTISIPEELLLLLELHKPKYQSLSGFCCQILEGGLDKSKTPQTMVEPAACKASSLEVTSKKKELKPKSIYPNLLQHQELIEEFWRVKRGSKSHQGWTLLMTELTKLQKLYGDAVVEEQLRLAANGLWKGVSVRLYEQFKAPRGATPAQPEQKHPAAREFRNGRFVDEEVTQAGVLEGLF